MYAVVKDGGRQLTLKEGQRVLVDHKDLQAGAAVRFDEVLLLGGETLKIGEPLVKGASVTGKVIGDVKADKIVVFHKRRRKNSKKKNGHRQTLTAIRIEKIQG